jgi:hypothetical protein
MKRITETVNEVLINIKKNPLDIKLLLLFSIVITFISELIQLDSNQNLFVSIIPFTGWSPGREYKMIFFFIILYSYIFRNHQKRLLILRGICTFYIGLSLYDGVSDWNTILPEDYTNPNPYLRNDSLRPIYTICLPLIWLLIISGSQLKDYFNNKKNKTIIIHQ